MAPITECMDIYLDKAASKPFDESKSKMVKLPILLHPDYEKIFEVACDTSHIGIGAVLSQEGHPMAYFSKKLMIQRGDTPLMMFSFMLSYAHSKLAALSFSSRICIIFKP